MAERDRRLRQRITYWNRLRSIAASLKMSLWFVPGASVLTAVAFAHLFAFVDELEVFDGTSAWFLFGGGGDSAQELLSTLATGIITLTGVVFSITVIVLQLAASQYTPRILRTFLSDRKTQAAMGLFLGTFAYNIVLLTKVRTGDGGNDEFVPALSIFLGYAAVLVCVLVFVDYIHHMAHSIRVVNIIKRVALEAHRYLDRCFPEDAPHAADRSIPWPDQPPSLTVHHKGNAGVLTRVDAKALLDLACEHDALVAIVPWTGDFIPHGSPIAHVWGNDPPDPDAVCQAVSVEDERNPNLDMAYGFRQLVDIAVRALSTSTNDPTTAIQALDRLHDLLRALAPRTMSAGMHTDRARNLRVIVPQQDWDSYVGLACDEIRQYGRGSIQVSRRLRAMLQDLLTIAPPKRRAILHRQLTLLDSDLHQSFEHPLDRSAARMPSAQGHGPN